MLDQDANAQIQIQNKSQPMNKIKDMPVQLFRERLSYGSVRADLEGTILPYVTNCEKMRPLNL